MCCAECCVRPLFTTKVTHESLEVRASGVDVELRGGDVEEALHDGDRVDPARSAPLARDLGNEPQ
eukprot:4387213-Pyramimonas_sp.AAC.1